MVGRNHPLTRGGDVGIVLQTHLLAAVLGLPQHATQVNARNGARGAEPLEALTHRLQHRFESQRETGAVAADVGREPPP
jgi:hypothetical protein